MILKNLISKENCYLLTHYLLRMGQESEKLLIEKEDGQVPGSIGILGHDYVFETLNEIIWPKLEIILNEKLIPTYSYARIYQNNNILKIHTDRPSCEVSVTLQLGRSHHYAWPIFVEDKRYDLEEGDGIVYFGCEQEHWRNKCDGPEGYYSGQVFLHYVREKGKYSDWAGDKRWKKDEIPFVRNRTKLMMEK